MKNETVPEASVSANSRIVLQNKIPGTHHDIMIKNAERGVIDVTLHTNICLLYSITNIT